jgi:hypothetical protein
MKTRDALTRLLFVLAVGAVGLAFTLNASAQVKTETTTTVGKSTHEMQVDRAQVVAVSGNDLVLKMEDGTTRNIENVPDSTTVTVDGKQLGIHDLKPGMTLQRTIVTTTTPKVVTTVETVSGKVWYVRAPSVLILKLEDGTNQQFTIPKGQMFNIEGGRMVDAFQLTKGMQLSATRITEEPFNSVSSKKHLTGTFPAEGAILVASGKPTGATEAASGGSEVASAGSSGTLPKTATFLPLIGLLGAISLAGSFGLKRLR